jgi:hypothetical protein
MLASELSATLITAAAALLAAIIGGLFVLFASKQSLETAAEEAAKQRSSDREAAELQFSRQLLSQGADRLLDALWTKERELCEALNMCRVAIEQGTGVSVNDESIVELGRLDLAVYQDMIGSLPFIRDHELRERMRSAAQMVNDCYNIRAGSSPDTVNGGTVQSIGRAMIEVQAYFKWLRWNLVCALEGEPLPPRVEMPNVRRPEDSPSWSMPSGVPPWT